MQQIRLDVDHARIGDIAPNGAFDGVDAARDFRERIAGLERHLGADQDLFRAEVLGAEVDDAQDALLPLDGGHDRGLLD